MATDSAIPEQPTPGPRDFPAPAKLFLSLLYQFNGVKPEDAEAKKLFLRGFLGIYKQDAPLELMQLESHALERFVPQALVISPSQATDFSPHLRDFLGYFYSILPIQPNSPADKIKALTKALGKGMRRSSIPQKQRASWQWRESSLPNWESLKQRHPLNKFLSSFLLCATIVYSNLWRTPSKDLKVMRLRSFASLWRTRLAA